MSLCRLDKRDDGEEIQEYLLEKTGQRSVPNIFISEYEQRVSYGSPFIIACIVI
jgi:glutaredoxin